MKIQTKIISGVLSVAVTMGALGVYAITELGEVADRGASIQSGVVDPLLALTDLQHLGDEATTDAVSVMNGPAQDRASSLQQLTDGVAEYDRRLAAFGERDLERRDAADYRRVVTNWSSLVKFANANLGTDIGVLDASAPAAGLDQAAGLIAKTNDLMSGMKARLAASAAQQADTMASTNDRAHRNLIVLLVVATLASIALALWLARRILRPLRQTVEVLDAVAGGDLTRQVAVSGKDELAQMGASLNATPAASAMPSAPWRRRLLPSPPRPWP